MAKAPKKQQRTDARRGEAEARQRLERERDEAIARLRDLGVPPDVADTSPAEGTTMAVDIGDVAQASERQDLAFATRERLAVRINRLTAALRRLVEGRWGRCEVCGNPIEPERLAAMPEAETCLRCQAEQERTAGRVA